MKLERLLLIYQLSYNHVDFISQEEQKSMGITNIFEDSQFCFKDKNHGLIVLPEYNILYLHYHGRNKIPNNSIYVRRITLEYEIVHKDAYIIPESEYKANNIPMFFNNKRQFVYFVRNYGIFISLDQHVVQIQY